MSNDQNKSHMFCEKPDASSDRSGIDITVDISPVPSIEFEPPKPPIHPLKCINFNAQIFKKLKNKQLLKYIAQYKHRPKQGSKEWVAQRQSCIGGSDIAAIIGKSPYASYIEWLRQKLGLTKQYKNLAMAFGKLFENVDVRFAEIVFNTEIHALPSVDGSIEGIRYSPDGLSIIELICEDTPEEESIRTAEYLTTLFEFKSPMMSIPDGKVPDHYMPQVKTGLCSIPIADIGIFMNNMIRKCSLDQLAHEQESAAYDMIFHKRDVQRRVKVGNPIAAGIIYVYRRQAELTAEELECIPIADAMSNLKLDDTVLPTNFIDYGKSNAPFGQFLEEYADEEDNGNIRIVVDTPVIYEAELEKIEFIGAQKEARADWRRDHDGLDMPPPKRPAGDLQPKDIGAHAKKLARKHIRNVKFEFTGVIPWKLYMSDIILVDKDPSYLDEYKSILTRTIEILKTTANMTPEEKTAYFAAELEKMCI